VHLKDAQSILRRIAMSFGGRKTGRAGRALGGYSAGMENGDLGSCKSRAQRKREEAT
jgi:hypothetical protein